MNMIIDEVGELARDRVNFRCAAKKATSYKRIRTLMMRYIAEKDVTNRESWHDEGLEKTFIEL
uniref:Uncharacterized protein n=1 Tax=Arion vulgaris TaxID=1028688 RepID=A0A0B7B458_9EUPU